MNSEALLKEGQNPPVSFCSTDTTQDCQSRYIQFTNLSSISSCTGHFAVALETTQHVSEKRLQTTPWAYAVWMLGRGFNLPGEVDKR